MTQIICRQNNFEFECLWNKVIMLSDWFKSVSNHCFKSVLVLNSTFWRTALNAYILRHSPKTKCPKFILYNCSNYNELRNVITDTTAKNRESKIYSYWLYTYIIIDNSSSLIYKNIVSNMFKINRLVNNWRLVVKILRLINSLWV